MTANLEKAITDVVRLLDHQAERHPDGTAAKLRLALLEALDEEKAEERRAWEGLGEPPDRHREARRCVSVTRTSWGEHRCDGMVGHGGLHSAVLGHGSAIDWAGES